jgi:hypothetical protein
MAGFVLIKCPHCRKPVDAHAGIHSGLGAPRLACWWCGTVYSTGRSEWRDRPASGKLWYLVLSLVYVAIGALLGGIALAGASHRWQHLGESRFTLGANSIALVVGAGLWGTVIALFQLYRIYASTRRSDSPPQTPGRASPWSFQTNLQAKFLGLIFLVSLLAWGLLSLISPPRG